jgi:hypothetical protein
VKEELDAEIQNQRELLASIGDRLNSSYTTTGATSNREIREHLIEDVAKEIIDSRNIDYLKYLLDLALAKV